MGSLVYIIFLVAVFWFILIRPQQQQAKKRAAMLEQMKPGVKIITIGGICGVVKAVTTNRVFVEIAEGLTIEMLRNSISQIVDEEEEEGFSEYDEDEEDEYEEDEEESDEENEK